VYAEQQINLLTSHYSPFVILPVYCPCSHQAINNTLVALHFAFAAWPMIDNECLLRALYIPSEALLQMERDSRLFCALSSKRWYKLKSLGTSNIHGCCAEVSGTDAYAGLIELQPCEVLR